MDMTIALKALLDNYHVSYKEIAKRMGIGAAAVSKDCRSAGINIKLFCKLINAAGIGLKITSADGNFISQLEYEDDYPEHELKLLLETMENGNVRWLARQMGVDDQTLRDSFNRESLRAKRFFDALDVIGAKYEFYSIKSGFGVSPLPRCISPARKLEIRKNFVSYRVRDSYPFANSFWAGKTEQIGPYGADELFATDEGVLFKAHFENATDAPKLSFVSVDDAVLFTRVYGRITTVETDEADPEIVRRIDTLADIKPIVKP